MKPSRKPYIPENVELTNALVKANEAPKIFVPFKERKKYGQAQQMRVFVDCRRTKPKVTLPKPKMQSIRSRRGGWRAP